MKKILVIFFVLTLLYGCASSGSIIMGYLEKIANNGTIDHIITCLGPPNAAQRINEDQILYIWGSSSIHGMMTPNFQNTTGMIGGTQFYANSMNLTPMYVNATCNIRVIANNNGQILNYGYEGNEFGCEQYADALKQYFAPVDATKTAKATNIATKAANRISNRIGEKNE